MPYLTRRYHVNLGTIATRSLIGLALALSACAHASADELPAPPMS